MRFRHEWNEETNTYHFYLIDHQDNETFIAEGYNGFDYDMQLYVVERYQTIGNVRNTTFAFNFECSAVKMVQRLNRVGAISRQIVTTFHNGIDQDSAVKGLIEYCQETYKKDHKAFDYNFGITFCKVTVKSEKDTGNNNKYAPINNLIDDIVARGVDFEGRTFSYLVPGYDIAVIASKQDDEEDE